MSCRQRFPPKCVAPTPSTSASRAYGRNALAFLRGVRRANRLCTLSGPHFPNALWRKLSPPAVCRYDTVTLARKPALLGARRRTAPPHPFCVPGRSYLPAALRGALGKALLALPRITSSRAPAEPAAKPRLPLCICMWISLWHKENITTVKIHIFVQNIVRQYEKALRYASCFVDGGLLRP